MENYDDTQNAEKGPDEAEKAEEVEPKEENESSQNDETASDKPGASQSSSSVLDINTEEMQKKLTEETQKMMTSAKSFGTYLFGVATEASKKVSETVNETATTLKKTMEEKTILGDLNREQKDFIEKKRERQGDGAVPPWVGYQEEEMMKQQILALSTDTRNFLRSPPSGVQFQFEFEQMFPVAMATLKEDENLNKMRFHLVPTKVKEETFWRNYFYRVSLIKQSAQLATLSELQKSENTASDSSTSSIVMVGSTATGTLSRSNSDKSISKSEPDGATGNPGDPVSPDLSEETDDLPQAEFVSDAFDPSTLNPDDLEREMRELGMDDGNGEGGIPEWEQELQKELQDYEVVQEDGKDEMWEQEIENMLGDKTDETS
ncbi:synapse-associated protein 1-like isoform X2 [Clavelina lepadiformis]|uniref:synapse-associated protein 1-like isoform X2 n=1 Tax=Clavelina lepadiformis TaxID=159417 RepID=UPI0040424A2A